jgi:alpha-D-ribose 1-methylphosphonate 5-triphosphate diphosphatase
VEFLDTIHCITEMPENAGFLKADHYFHWRCEVPSAHVLEQLSTMLNYSRLRMLSVMDHTPGQRQFSDLDHYANYHRGLLRINDDQMSSFIADRIADHKANSARHRAAVVALAHERGLKLASHDDATTEHVEEAVRDGMAVAEFPTTVEAARASHAGGIRVMMGAPNVVRGSSHTGNVSADELGSQGVLDILSSDYLPSSLLYGATLLAERSDTITLPQAIATVTSTPAQAMGLEDRGELAVGLRADMVRFRMIEGAPIIRDVWRGGVKVA